MGFGNGPLATAIGGKCVELDGKRVLGPFSVDIEDVEAALGKPDSTGFAGVTMCEGPYPGYRYEQLKLSADFSASSRTFFRLQDQRKFMDFGSDPNAPDLAHCIAGHRRGHTFALPRGLD